MLNIYVCVFYMFDKKKLNKANRKKFSQNRFYLWLQEE